VLLPAGGPGVWSSRDGFGGAEEAVVPHGKPWAKQPTIVSPKRMMGEQLDLIKK